MHALEARPLPKAPPSRARLGAFRSLTESIFPRGNLTFSGVVVHLSPESLVLRTRSDGPKTLLIRPDTRYLEGGSQVDLPALKVNTRVFVRAGRNFEGEIEAYQVVWGEILLPK